MAEKSQHATDAEKQDSHKELIDRIVDMSNAEDYSHIFRKLTLAFVNAERDLRK